VYCSYLDSDDVSPLFPVNSLWRRVAGAERQASNSPRWGFATELVYGGNMGVDKKSSLPPALGGRGNSVGSYDQARVVVLAVYGNWSWPQ
jgi:hypothetical protein